MLFSEQDGQVVQILENRKAEVTQQLPWNPTLKMALRISYFEHPSDSSEESKKEWDN